MTDLSGAELECGGGGAVKLQRIVLQYVLGGGYDGLCSDLNECGCHLDDLMPCEGFNVQECVPGWKHYDPKYPTEWCIFDTKEPPTEEQWEKVRWSYT